LREVPDAPTPRKAAHDRPAVDCRGAADRRSCTVMPEGPIALLTHATRRTRGTALSLVLANLVPLIGVLLLGWSPFSVVMAYVLETVIIGVYTWLRMALAQQSPPGKRLFTIVFFTFHYGLFVAVQTVFITLAVGIGDASDPAIQRELAVAGAGFVISHGISFFTHYLGAGEFRQANATVELFRPYGRIFVQQFVAIFGFFVMLTLGGARVGPVVVLVVCKLLIDLRAHLRSHATDPAGQRD